MATNAEPFSSTPTARLQALYSDFPRHKQSNPAAYHANVEWWRKALETLVSSGIQQDLSRNTGSRLVLRANRAVLDQVKIEKIGRPLALGAVVNELRTNKTLIPLSEFMTSRASIYDPGWLPYRIASLVVGRPLWWALEQVGIVGDEVLGSSSRLQKETSWWGDYAFVGLVEKAADAIVSLQDSKMTGPADAIYTWDGFRKSFAGIFGPSNEILDEMDTKVVTRYLERERKVLVLDNEVVKFVDGAATDDERVITAMDRGILELKSAIANMHNQIDGIQRKMDQCTSKARIALQHQQQSLALSYLKSRRQLEELFNKRTVSLGTLEGTLLSIETAAGDIQIMKAYQSSTVTLRAILAHPSLQRESIDKTMDALAEANQGAQEIDSAIRMGGDVAIEVDAVATEDELEEEWRTLLRDIETDGLESSDMKRTLDSTQVPSGTPCDDKVVEPVKVALPYQ